MARFPADATSGTVAATGDVVLTADAVYDALIAAVTARQVASTQSWELLESIAVRDNIYVSRGDRNLASGAGDAWIPVGLNRLGNNGIRVEAKQDYSPISSTGAREISSTSGNVGMLSFGSGDAVNYWIVVEDYEVYMVTQQGTEWRLLGFGSPPRDHIPDVCRGVGFSTAAVSPGTSVVVPLDRDLTANLQVGQLCWIYNTSEAVALQSDVVTVATVEAVTANSVTLDSLAQGYGAGAIVGLDPCPVFQVVSVTALTTFFFTNHLTGAHNSATGQGHTIEPFLEQVQPNQNSPSPTGFYPGGPISMDNGNATNGGNRAGPLHFGAFFGSALPDGEIIRTGFVPGDDWWIFPNLPNIGNLRAAIGGNTTL